METMHNERIRIALMTLAMLLIGAIFAGCGAQKAEAPDLQALYDRILEETDAPTFISITPERLERVYGIRTEDYAQAVFVTCEDGLRIDEIWLVETKDENEAWSFAKDLHSQGYPANVYLTTDWSNLNAEPWYVVSAGEYNSEKEAYFSLGWVQKVCGDAYVKWTGEFVG